MNRNRLLGLALAACLVVQACGSFIPDSGDGGEIKVNGTVTTVVVDDATRDIVVFVYTDICNTNNADPLVCADLELPEDLPLLGPNDYRSVRKATVSTGRNRRFLVVKVKNGDLTVVFLQDSAADPDETIDPEDITIARDAQGDIVPDANNAVAVLAHGPILEDVFGETVVALEDVAIDFPGAAADATATNVTVTTSSTVVTN